MKTITLTLISLIMISLGSFSMASEKGRNKSELYVDKSFVDLEFDEEEIKPTPPQTNFLTKKYILTGVAVAAATIASVYLYSRNHSGNTTTTPKLPRSKSLSDLFISPSSDTIPKLPRSNSLSDFYEI